MGAGFVAAYGFKPNGIAVSRPVARATSDQIIPRDPAKRRSVCREFKQTVRDVAGADIDFYIEFRSHASQDTAEPV